MSSVPRPKEKSMGRYFKKKEVSGIAYLNMLQNYLFPHPLSPNLNTSFDNKTVLLIIFFIMSEIGEQCCSATMDMTCRSEWHGLLPMASTVSRAHSILWGYVKVRVYLPPLPVDLPDVRKRIVSAVEFGRNSTMLQNYRFPHPLSSNLKTLFDNKTVLLLIFFIVSEIGWTMLFSNDGYDVPVRMTWFTPDGLHGLPISCHVISFCEGMWRSVCSYRRYLWTCQTWEKGLFLLLSPSIQICRPAFGRNSTIG